MTAVRDLFSYCGLMPDSVLNFSPLFCEAGSFISCFRISLAAVCIFMLVAWNVHVEVSVVGSWKLLSAVWPVKSSYKSVCINFDNFFRKQDF